VSENRKRILDMLAQGKVTVEEAERLLSTIGEPSGEVVSVGTAEGAAKAQPKFLRVVVEPAPGQDAKQDRVNIRIPVAVLRAGIKFASFIPTMASTQINEQLRKQGIDLDIRDLKFEDLEKVVDSLGELQVDVDTPQEKVAIYFE